MAQAKSKKLSIVIMAHPSRAGYIPYLKDMLGKDVPVVFDKVNNIWDTCRRAWLAQDRSAEWAIVIQDDALVCRDFKKRAEAILHGDYVWSLYLNHMLAKKIADDEAKGRTYIVRGAIHNEIALCMRTEHIDDMVKYCDDREAKTDTLIGRWAQERRIGIAYPMYSLIDHRDEESLFYKIHRRVPPTKARRAIRFIDHFDARTHEK